MRLFSTAKIDWADIIKQLPLRLFHKNTWTLLDRGVEDLKCFLNNKNSSISGLGLTITINTSFVIFLSQQLGYFLYAKLTKKFIFWKQVGKYKLVLFQSKW